MYHPWTKDVSCVSIVESYPIFEGDDFGPSPLHADDSLDTVAALLGFLTCKPGDTDREYFASYTPLQLDWCTSSQAENLSLWVYDRENKR